MVTKSAAPVGVGTAVTLESLTAIMEARKTIFPEAVFDESVPTVKVALPGLPGLTVIFGLV